MTAFRNRLLGLAAGTLALSSFSSMAYAQGPEEVLDFAGSTFIATPASSEESFFSFNQPYILNNIGFVVDSSVADAEFGFDYAIDGQMISVSSSELDTATNGVRYFKSFTAQPIAKDIVIEIFSYNSITNASYTRSGFTQNLVGVTHSSMTTGYASGNLRVTPLGGSVAPEPGSFALALTGGAALLGICIRRRRNAA